MHWPFRWINDSKWSVCVYIHTHIYIYTASVCVYIYLSLSLAFSLRVCKRNLYIVDWHVSLSNGAPPSIYIINQNSSIYTPYMGFSINGDTQNGWFIRENPCINWDLGVAPFQETPICISRNILRYVKPSLPSLQGTREVLRSLRASPFQSFVAKDLAKGKVAFSNAFLRRWGLMRSNRV